MLRYAILCGRHSPRQDAYVVHEPLDQILVLVLRVAGQREVALAAHLGGGDLNLEFVLEVGFRGGLDRDVS